MERTTLAKAVLLLPQSLTIIILPNSLSRDYVLPIDENGKCKVPKEILSEMK